MTKKTIESTHGCVCALADDGVAVSRIARTMRMTPREVRGILHAHGRMMPDMSRISAARRPDDEDEDEVVAFLPRQPQPARAGRAVPMALDAGEEPETAARVDHAEACRLHLADLARAHPEMAHEILAARMRERRVA